MSWYFMPLCLFWFNIIIIITWKMFIAMIFIQCEWGKRTKIANYSMGTNDFINIMFTQAQTITHQPLTIRHWTLLELSHVPCSNVPCCSRFIIGKCSFMSYFICSIQYIRYSCEPILHCSFAILHSRFATAADSIQSKYM